MRLEYKWYYLGVALGTLLGFVLAIAVIDTRAQFTIPFVDKTFMRVYGQQSPAS